MNFHDRFSLCELFLTIVQISEKMNDKKEILFSEKINEINENEKILKNEKINENLKNEKINENDKISKISQNPHFFQSFPFSEILKILFTFL